MTDSKTDGTLEWAHVPSTKKQQTFGHFFSLSLLPLLEYSDDTIVLLHTNYIYIYIKHIICCSFFFLRRSFVYECFSVSSTRYSYTMRKTIVICNWDRALWSIQTWYLSSLINFSDSINRLHLNKFIWRMLQVSFTLFNW